MCLCSCDVRWFKYITDAAEAYKAKDGGKGKRPTTSIGGTDSSSVNLSDTQEASIDDNEASSSSSCRRKDKLPANDAATDSDE